MIEPFVDGAQTFAVQAIEPITSHSTKKSRQGERDWVKGVSDRTSDT